MPGRSLATSGEQRTWVNKAIDCYHIPMQPLQNKKILLGISGGIASYKSEPLSHH